MPLDFPVDTFHQDFSCSLQTYTVLRTSKSLQGIINIDEGGQHVGFKYGCDIIAGDVLTDQFGSLTVKRIVVETYLGRPELVKAYC